MSIETIIGLKKAEKASELLLKAIIETEKALETPEPEIKYNRIEEKLELEASYWVKKSSEVKKSRTEVLKAYSSEMDKAGLLEEKDEKKK